MLQNLLAALSFVGIPAAADSEQHITDGDVSDACGAVRWPVS